MQCYLVMFGMGILVFLYLAGMMFAIASVFESYPWHLWLAWLMLIPPIVVAYKQSLLEKGRGSKYQWFFLIFAILPIPILLASTWSILGYSSSCSIRLEPNGRLISCNFDGADLSHKDLHGSDFSHASLRGTNFEGSDLQMVNFEYADLENADLTDALLDEAILSDTRLIHVIGLSDQKLADLLKVLMVYLPQELARREIWLESEEEIRNALAAVCRGNAVGLAAVYTKDHPFHPVILLQSNGYYHTWGSDVRSLAWLPMAIRHAEMVACASPQEAVLIQKCGYMGVGGGSYQRYQYQQKIKLVAASSLDIISEVTLMGSMPLACPEAIAAGSHGSDYGYKVNFAQVKDWLSSYVYSP